MFYIFLLCFPFFTIFMFYNLLCFEESFNNNFFLVMSLIDQIYCEQSRFQQALHLQGQWMQTTCLLFILINFLSYYHFIIVRVAFLWLIKVEKGVGSSYQERMQTTFCTKLLVTIKSFCRSNEIRHFSKSAILCFANNLKKCSAPIF